jgi:chromosome segregation ATPase
MCKKLGVTALAIVAALFVLHKLDLDSYVKVWINKTKAEVKRQIPPETKIERLRDEIAKLGPEESKARSVIAREIVEVNKLKDQIAATKTNLDKNEATIKDIRAALEKGTEFVSTDGSKLPRAKVEASLTRKWETFKSAKEALKSQEELLKSREDSLEVAKARLDVMQEKRKEMEAKVEKMANDLQKLRLAQTKHDVAIDDTQLATVLQLADEIDTQIQTQRTELDLQKGAVTDQAVEEALAHKARTDKALKEMDEAFGNTKLTKKD